MLKSAKQMDMSPRAEIGQLVQRAAADGVRWAETELKLARAELGDLRRRCVIAAIFAVLAIATVLCALIILAQAGVAAAALYLGSEIGGGLAVGALLLVLTAVCAIIMSRMFNWNPESLLFRWMTNRT